MKAWNILLIVIIFAVGACGTPMSRSVSPETELFSRAEQFFEQKAYGKAMSLYNQYLTRYPDGPSAPLALMREASIHIEHGKQTAARKAWQYLIRTHPNSVFVPEARIGILGSLYEDRAYAQVIREGEQFLKSIATYHPRVRVIMGDAYLALNSLNKALETYSLAYSHAASSEKEEIRRKIKATVALLSEQELGVLNGMSGYNPLLKGYLMYQMGLKHIKAEKYEDAIKVLSELTENLPQHEMVPEAKNLIARFEHQKETPVSDSMSVPQPIPGQSRYKIGCLLPLSGSYMAYGTKALRAVELAKQRIAASGYPPAEMVVKDSGVLPEQAVQAVRELDEQQVSAIIGPMTISDAAAAEARSLGIPTIMMIQKSDTDTGNYLFRNFITPENQVEAVVSYAMNTGIGNFAVLYPNEKYGTSFLALFTQAVNIRGGKIVFASAYSPNQTDFSSSLKKLAQIPFEALFIPDSAKKVGLILPQMSFNKIPEVRLFGTNLWHSDKLIQMAGQYAQGAVVPDGFIVESSRYPIREFVNQFQAAYKEKPEYIEAIAYDTAMILFQILAKPGTRSRNDVRDDLLRLKNFQGVTGTTSFDARGEAIKKPYLLRVDRDRFVEIETP